MEQKTFFSPAVQEVLTWLQAYPAAQLSSDSRSIQAGDVFFAYADDESDGRIYIADAIARGAVAVVYEEQAYVWDDAHNVPHLAIAQLRQIAGYVANAFYGQPDKEMFTVAVTGTNGKTSTAYWLGAAMSRLQTAPAAVIGTLGVGMFQKGQPHTFDVTGYTTPDAVLLQRHLLALQQKKAASLAIEASSIGLDQGRMHGLHVDVALFTNLTRDHLDYHVDMAQYARAKQVLFDWPGLKQGVINLDDAAGVHYAQHLQSKGIAVVGYTLEEATLGDVPVLRASALKSSHTGTTFQVSSPFGVGLVKTQLVGRFNVSNVLGVLGVLLSQGTTWETAVATIGALTAVPGRMQQIGGQDAPLIVIDYAHTPDALEKVLTALRQVADQRGGKLWCLFGCGGDRDAGKRSQMGQVAEMADQVILTSDNSRSEETTDIIAQIRSGMQREPQVQEDRASAILWAVRHAGKQDVVLLAGKGHEAYQETAGKKKPFLDADHAALAFAARATKMGGI